MFNASLGNKQIPTRNEDPSKLMISGGNIDIAKKASKTFTRNIKSAAPNRANRRASKIRPNLIGSLETIKVLN